MVRQHLIKTQAIASVSIDQTPLNARFISVTDVWNQPVKTNPDWRQDDW